MIVLAFAGGFLACLALLLLGTHGLMWWMDRGSCARCGGTGDEPDDPAEPCSACGSK
jgi:hypothetical protein